MLRRLRTILCGICLLIFLILLIAWPFAHRRPVGIWYKRTKTDFSREFINLSHFYFLTIERNQISIGHWRDPKLVYLIQQSRFTKEPSAAELSAMMAQLRFAAPGFPPPPAPPPIHKSYNAPDRFFLPDGLRTGPNPRHPWPPDPTHTWSHFGISFEGEETAQIQLHRLMLPIWLPLLLLATPPFLLLRRGYHQYRLRRANRCLRCGYDLRATPTLCPECGQPTDAALSP